MAKRLLTIGECMVELSSNPDGSYRKGYAGDSFNTAWYAARLSGDDVDVCYLTALGDDAVSDDMCAFMERSGVRPLVSVRKGASVGLYMISLKDGERSFSYWRSASAARSLADDLERVPEVGPGDIVLVTGITLAILTETGRENLMQALATARAEGVTIAFDPNLRPRLWKDANEMRHWVMRGAALADIALPSFEDEATHFGDADVAATVKRYRSAGAKCVIVKNGPQPVVVSDGDTMKEVAVDPAPTIVDTTSAGDSFNARFLLGLLGGEAPETAVAAANQISRKVIQASGALVEV